MTRCYFSSLFLFYYFFKATNNCWTVFHGRAFKLIIATLVPFIFVLWSSNKIIGHRKGKAILFPRHLPRPLPPPPAAAGWRPPRSRCPQTLPIPQVANSLPAPARAAATSPAPRNPVPTPSRGATGCKSKQTSRFPLQKQSQKSPLSARVPLARARPSKPGHGAPRLSPGLAARNAGSGKWLSPRPGAKTSGSRSLALAPLRHSEGLGQGKIRKKGGNSHRERPRNHAAPQRQTRRPPAIQPATGPAFRSGPLQVPGGVLLKGSPHPAGASEHPFPSPPWSSALGPGSRQHISILAPKNGDSLDPTEKESFPKSPHIPAPQKAPGRGEPSVLCLRGGNHGPEKVCFGGYMTRLPKSGHRGGGI